MEVTKLNKICLKGTDTIQLLPASISSVVEKNWGRNWKLVRTAIERREREVVTREQRETCTGVGWKGKRETETLGVQFSSELQLDIYRLTDGNVQRHKLSSIQNRIMHYTLLSPSKIRIFFRRVYSVVTLACR